MHPASPNMSSLSTLLLLLFLFCSGLRAGNGRPVNTTTVKVVTCNAVIQEIRGLLQNTSSLNPTDKEDKRILVNASRKLNLYKFINASDSLMNKTNIKKNLELLEQCLPTHKPPVTPTRNPIFIIKGNWDDFRKKLQYYLKILEEELDPASIPGIPH